MGKVKAWGWIVQKDQERAQIYIYITKRIFELACRNNEI
jgi:hypothetical protein